MLTCNFLFLSSSGTMPQRGLRRLALEDYDDGGRDGWEEQEEEEDYYFEVGGGEGAAEP